MNLKSITAHSAVALSLVSVCSLSHASFFDNLFRNGDYYDLSPVGRYKLNQRLNKTDHADLRTLADDDILDAIKVLVQLKDSHGPADDIDHLGNRRVRLVGELVENQYRMASCAWNAPSRNG